MNFIKFGHPQYLYFLALIPALIFLYIYAFKRKRQASERFSDFRLFQQLASSVDFKRQKVKSLMVIFGYIFLAIALARPQFGSGLELVKRRGLDIMVALDISLSMQAEVDVGLSTNHNHDVKPNRFQRAKHEIRALIDKLNGDRVGLILFAGASFVQCPLTDDYDAAKMFLDVPPQPEYLFQQGLIQPGTDIGKAIRCGIKVFQRQETKKETRNADGYGNTFAQELPLNEPKYKAIILVTDGENLTPSSDPIQAAREAAEAGIHVYTLGVGVEGQSALIPLHDHAGNFTGYKKDETGAHVLTRLNDTLLRKISVSGGGRYYLSSAKGSELDDLYQDMSSLERRELEKLKFTRYEERFQYFLFLALLLLIVEFILSDSKMKFRAFSMTNDRPLEER